MIVALAIIGSVVASIAVFGRPWPSAAAAVIALALVALAQRRPVDQVGTALLPLVRNVWLAITSRQHRAAPPGDDDPGGSADLGADR